MAIDAIPKWNPPPFIRKEMNRLVDLIPKTDPRERSYEAVLRSLELFIGMSGTIEEILNKYPVEAALPSVLPTPVAKEEEPEIIPFPVPQAEEEKFIEMSGKIEAIPVKEPEPDPPAEPEEPTVEYSEADVKKAISRARADGKIESVAAWITDNWGVKGFPAIPAKKYPEVVAKLKELGVDV